jgi:hypothetical protein
MDGEKDDTSKVREDLEVDRLRDQLAAEFDDVAPDRLERDIRDEFERRSSYPIQEFVPLFVERSLRQMLRH